MEMFNHTLGIAAEDAGFYFFKRPFQDKFLRYSGEVAPALWLDIKHVSGLGHKFLCYFGFDVMSFETEWTDYLALVGFDQKTGDSMGPIGVHSHNYDLGMQPPYLRKNSDSANVDEMYDWMALMFRHALKFPTSMQQLVDILSQGSILGLELSRAHGQPVKVRAFYIWLKHNKIIDLMENIAPISAARVWPYANVDIDHWCE